MSFGWYSNYSGEHCCHVFFFFKQKTAYEMRISDWSSDVCSSDLRLIRTERFGTIPNPGHRVKTSNQADATNQPSHDLPAAEQRRSERQGSHRPASCAKRLDRKSVV